MLYCNEGVKRFAIRIKNTLYTNKKSFVISTQFHTNITNNKYEIQKK